jgi:hypothetical protein
MAASSLGRRRPRPVADAPVLDGAALAKAWLVELVAVAPLERAAALPGPRFADDAPRVWGGGGGGGGGGEGEGGGGGGGGGGGERGGG